MPRVSPLAAIAKPGRFGADRGAPGVTLSVRHPLEIVTVIARKGKAKAVAARLKGMDAKWAGPEQYFVYGIKADQLAKQLAGLASCADQSHGRVVIRIDGARARDVLAKGTPVDLYTEEFPPGKSALTQMAHVGVHLTRLGADVFELSVFRGFSENFWEWLTVMSAEYGYQVE